MTFIAKWIGSSFSYSCNNPDSYTFYSDSDYIILFEGIITNKEDLIHLLGFSSNPSPALLLSAAFNKWSFDCASKIKGEYCFVIYDKNSNDIFASRDHVGVIPLFYYQEGNNIILSPDAKAILNLQETRKELNIKWPLFYLLKMPDENWGTINKHLSRLVSGHYLIFKNNVPTLKRFWFPSVKNIREKTNVDYVDRFKQILNSAISHRIPNSNHIGSELSGGLDSSVIVGYANQICRDRQINLSVFSETYPENIDHKISHLYNERVDSDLVAKHCGIKNPYLVTNEEYSLQELLELANQVHFEPSFIMVNIFSSGIYRKAQSLGIHDLFTGFGGDEFVSTHHIIDFRTLFQEHDYGSAIKLLFKNYAGIPLPDPERVAKLIYAVTGYKFQKRRSRINEKVGRLFINKDMMDEYNLASKYKEHKRGSSYRSYYDQFEQKLFGKKYLPNRLHACYAMTKHYGISYRYPLLDVDLLEYFFSIPNILKGNNNLTRRVFRMAAKGVIPEKIAYKKRVKGASNPSALHLGVRDQGKILHILKDYTHSRNHKIHDYIDLDKVIKHEEKKLDSGQLFHSKAVRLYLLCRKLDEY